MVQPIRTVMSRMGTLQTGIAATERIFAMLNTPTESTDRARTDPGRLRGEVVFEDVRFAYTEGQEVLKGISLSVRPGERVAVVGPTGSGKSTLVDLIPRFYDPTSGRVLIDGYEADTLLLPRLRRQIGIVPQESVLMKGSIAFNIAYGLPARAGRPSDPQPNPLDDPELMSAICRAAHIAEIDKFIEGLPEGYATEVGERGVTLSGGQRQRIAIARAVVRDPRILILDEATSSLDLAVERQVQEAMNRAMAGRTSFVIAHRLSTVRTADRILVLEGGRIVQEGTHESLIREGGLYSRLHRLQFDEAGRETAP